ncbi:hypothetical protein DUI87_34275 [Hirundo rustica rustica]|uniref:Peptidase M12B propeptide domain-containing protein n=1 Tax=Hirundo rustica rustica TaxID=333673 RepID=A0A3M0IR42_HIRRU|nr:hypothetical protein DUI87_34275 [Hirundo rustica rustica]
MDCLLLAVWTLPAAILGGGSMRFQTLPWLGSAVKAGRERFSLAVAWCAFVPDYVFVTPVRVDASGSYISHDVLHSTRRKRSTQSSKSSLHYKFSAFGQELHLELKPSTILSSSFIVQVLGKDGVSNSQEHEIEQCFYQEFIRNDSTSSVCRLALQDKGSVIPGALALLIPDSELAEEELNLIISAVRAGSGPTVYHKLLYAKGISYRFALTVI